MNIVGRLAAGAAGVGLAVFAGTGAMDDNTARDDSGAIVEAGGLGAYVMQVGDCFNDPDGAEVISVEAVPCAIPHDNEVFAEFELLGSEWPGEFQVEDDAWNGCYSWFTTYVGSDFETSALNISALQPVQAGWTDGDRLVTCFVFDNNFAPMTGTMRNSGV